MQRFNFLKSVLQQSAEFKLYDLNNVASEIQYTNEQTIYDIGHESSAFYIVKEGVILLETTIEIDNYEKHPIKNMEWKVTK
jgi:hypothetical protein